MHKHRWLLAILLVFLHVLPVVAWGQDGGAPATPGELFPEIPEPPPGFENPEATVGKMLEDIEAARWKLTPGFDLDTGLNISATSRVARAFDMGPSVCSFIVFDGKGDWSSAVEAKNHAEAAFNATYAYCRVKQVNEGGSVAFKVPVVVGLTGDIRSKWGSFETGEGDQKQTFEGNQYIGGAGLTLLFPSAPKWLDGFELTTAYYQVIESEGDLPVAEELDVDHLQARLRSRLLLFERIDKVAHPLLGSIALLVDSRASRALDGAEEGDLKYYTSLGLEIGKGKTAATVRWESGEEVGFQYDEKLVLGILFRFFDADENGDT